MKVYTEKELEMIKQKRRDYSKTYYDKNTEKVKKMSKVRYNNLKSQLDALKNRKG